MKSTRIYLLTPNSPSPRTLRLWTGQSVHTLRHCSLKDIANALVGLQERVESLQKDMVSLQQVKDPLVAISAGGREISKRGAGFMRQAGAGVDEQGRVAREARLVSVDQDTRRVPLFRNTSQKARVEERGRGKTSRIRGYSSPR